MKEAKILSEIKHDNIVTLLGVCEKPISLMMELCEFDFQLLNADKIVSSMDLFLSYMNKEDIFDSFPGIGNIIASNIVRAVSYLHNRNIVHRDIKPAKILVSNFHYKNYKHEELEMAFGKEPVVCKVGDLGEA